jgi:O-antigen ligase
VNRVVLVLLMLLVVLAPLPLGANREWSWTLCATITSSIALLWVAAAVFQPNKINLKLKPTLMLMFMLVCGWSVLQTVSWTPTEWHHPLWQMSSEALGSELNSRISVSEDDSLTALMRLLSYGLVFILSFQLGQQRERAFNIYRVLAFAGLAYAIYGLITFWGGSGSTLLFKNDAISPDVRSTFVNRNSYATYAGLTLLCAMAWFYQSIVMRRSNQTYDMPMGKQLRIEQFILKTWKPATALLLMGTALILTHSRGGFISTVAASITLLVALNYRQPIGNVRSKAVIGTAIAIAILAFVMSSEVLLERMNRIDLDGNGRVIVYEQVADSLQYDPNKGHGYGTFSDSFRMFRGEQLTAQYDKAHNTYLENIFELGWPAALLLFSSIAWLGLICISGVRNRGRDWVYPATGLAATVLVGIHSAVDFSLQIPAVSISYACIMGVGCAQSYSSRT